MAGRETGKGRKYISKKRKGEIGARGIYTKVQCEELH